MDRNRAYLDALKMLGRRDLSETQVRQRLAGLGHSSDDIDVTVAQLKEERAIDDERVAGAIARREALIRRRGVLRVRRQIEHAGIPAATARRAADEVLAGVDAGDLLEAALARRLKGPGPIADEREFRRLYRFLVGQGFEPDLVLARLKKAK